jgi:excisionase family DNA binding protein
MSTKKRLLLTKNELAELLAVTPRTIDNWVRNGKLPNPRFDKPPRWLTATIQKWLECGGERLDDYFTQFQKVSD